MRVLITDAVHPILIERLTSAGYQINYTPSISRDEVLAVIQHYQGIVINSKIICDKNFVDKAENLQFIARLGSGIEIIDVAYAQSRNIAVYRSPEGNCDAVAEHAIGMLLSLSNKLLDGDRAVRNMEWDREANRGWELGELTVGVIGFGFTGKAFCKRIAPFCKRILVYDKYVKGFGSDRVKECSSLQDLFEHVDIVSLHIPFNDETRGLVDSSFIKSFKKPFVLINTSRGGIVKTDTLIDNLKNGNIRGACLDVFENEKPKTYTKEEENMYKQLFSLSNIVFSPHVAGWTVESKYKLANLLADRILMV